ncbi:phage baseplate assembly protein V [Acrocarpospora macrocephala]|uniref:Baseplate assembly protein n=1 Tax=Acrocarpospora macrocephala TaxID=150177 RepID=A0A5M3WTE9_9ACTN|nr:phage baseplate assembly protein V [Acrocarpospora macrocephala]GES11940.1 baseplate assembly protein [Acrocarpospora macrocephala]
MPDRTFYGKYRGTVFSNTDPEQRGRIQAVVPDVSGTIPTSWALPCLPIAGKQMGVYVLPQVGSGVWIEFEQGDPDFPIWSGCYWGSAAEVPAQALAGNPASPSVVVQTSGQNTLVISDLPGPTGGIMLRSATGATIIVNDTGIYLQNGKGASLVLTGPSVNVNNGGLVVI